MGCWVDSIYRMKRVRTLDEDRISKGNKGTFIVHIQARQNATWQGNVVWAEKDVTRNFRSALELLKMIDTSLDDVDAE